LTAKAWFTGALKTAVVSVVSTIASFTLPVPNAVAAPSEAPATVNACTLAFVSPPVDPTRPPMVVIEAMVPVKCAETCVETADPGPEMMMSSISVSTRKHAAMKLSKLGLVPTEDAVTTPRRVPPSASPVALAVPVPLMLFDQLPEAGEGPRTGMQLPVSKLNSKTPASNVDAVATSDAIIQRTSPKPSAHEKRC